MNTQNSDLNVNIPLSRSLFGKLLFFLLLIGLVPVILNAGFGYMKFQQGLVEAAVSSQEIFEEDQSDFLLSWSAERTQDIQTLAGVARIASLNPETAAVAIQQYYKMWGIYETIFLTGLDGKAIVTSNGKPLDVYDRQYFKEAVSGKT